MIRNDFQSQPGANTLKFIYSIVLILFTLLVCPPGSLSAVEQSGPDDMVIRADLMEHDTASDQVTARGTVEMTWQDMTMTADQATLNRTTNLLVATGNVYLTKAGDILWGDRLVLDTETGRAEMDQGRIFLSQGNFRAQGETISRLGDDSYSMRSGELTTCDATVPSWKFGASKLDVTVEEYAVGKHVVFYVKDIPVFYFPYIILPVKRERQSGFLFPKLGNSSKRGVSVDIPYYWAISPSQEATINMDIQTRRGIGVGLDYRYLRSRDSVGSLGGYLINDTNENKLRGELVQFHREQLDHNLSFISSLNLVSDKTFLQDYSDKNGDYNRQYNDSRAVLTKYWDTWLTSAQAIYTQDFTTGSNTTTLQRAPELSLYGVREALTFIPNLYLDLDLQLTNYYRDQGMQGQRAILEPRLTTVHNLLGGRLSVSLYAAAQLRGYNVTDAAPGTDERDVLLLPKAGAQVSSSLGKVYDTTLFGFTRLRHELVPAIDFLYIGAEEQDTLPLFDQFDRVNRQQTISFSLASHLGGKLQHANISEYRNLMTLRLLQQYTFNGTRTGLTSLTDDERAWGDLILESETWLHRRLRLLLDIRYNHQEADSSSTAAGVEYNDQRGNTAQIAYRNTDQRVEYLEAGTTLSLTAPFYITYKGRYSLDGKEFLESTYALEYRHQCWSVLFTFQHRPDSHSWGINVNLAGLFDNSSALKRPAAARQTVSP